jgi:hypothetical protein
MSGKLHFVSTLAISELWHSLSFNPENPRLTNASVCQFSKILFIEDSAKSETWPNQTRQSPERFL